MALNSDVTSATRWQISEDLPLSTAAKVWPCCPCWYDRSKAIMDFVLALIMLVLVSPVLALAALAVKLTSRGPIFYSQTRSGKGGRPYSIYKLRSMRHNCESKSGACWSKPGDDRITLVGRFLRRSHIDELPQLWNILRGEMSLVGPRPERPEFVHKLSQALPQYSQRLSLLPGLTGLAQIQLPPDTDLDSVRRKLAHDLYYLENRSLWLDLRIILSTAFVVMALPFAVPRFLFRIPSGRAVEAAVQPLNHNADTAVLMSPALSTIS